MPVGKLTEQGPGLIKEASKSPLGVLSLIIFLLSIVSLYLFGDSPELVKISIFALLVLAAGGCVWALMRAHRTSETGKVEPPRPEVSDLKIPEIKELSPIGSEENPQSLADEQSTSHVFGELTQKAVELLKESNKFLLH